jgi:hypothetical protein
LDPLYCDVIVQRWRNFSGRQAERRERLNHDRPSPRSSEGGRP